MMHLTLEQQVHSLHHRYVAALLFNLVIGALFCLVFRTQASMMLLMIWFCALLFASAIRFSISWYYSGENIVDSEFIRTLILYCVGLASTIVVWTSASIFFFPVHSVPHQCYLALTLCGILAQAMPVLSVNKDIYRALIVVILAPLSLQLAYHTTTEIQAALVLLLLLIGATLYKSAMFLATSFQRLQNISSELSGMLARDNLTQVATRRAFDDRVVFEWKTANRHQSHLSLLMIDIDHFKSYNNTYGHEAGDQCLRKVAQAIVKSVLRGTDFVARYGSEEFSVLLPATDALGAKTVAERIRQQVQRLCLKHEASPVSEFVSVSLGLATLLPKKESVLQNFIESADKALYLSKSRGRNCISTDADSAATMTAPEYVTAVSELA